MKLGDLLFSILEKQGVVVIPNFGIIVENKRSAKIIDGKVTPPSSDYRFNCTNTADDGVLVSSWARVKNTSYNDARIDVYKQIKELGVELFDKGHANLDGLGSFKLTKNNKTEFTIDKSMLSPEKFIDNAVAISSVGKKEKKNTVKPKPKKQDKANTKKRKGGFVIWGILILLLLLIGAWFLMPTDTRNKLVADAEQSLTAFDAKDNAGIDADSATDVNAIIMDTAQILIDSSGLNDTLINANHPTVDDSPMPGADEFYTLEMTDSKFFVIAGQFSLKSNAESLYRSLKDKGYTPVLMGKHSGLYQVAIGGYTKRFSADSLELTLRNSTQVKDCWVLDLSSQR